VGGGPGLVGNAYKGLPHIYLFCVFGQPGSGWNNLFLKKVGKIFGDVGEVILSLWNFKQGGSPSSRFHVLSFS
jgi:hypothetical protein